MKKILPLLIFLFPLFIYSENISLPQAHKAACNFFKQHKLPYQEIQFIKNMEDTYTGENLIYFFRVLPKGFILVSADDNVEPVLGFSAMSDFEIDDISPSLQQWINSYKDQILYAKNEDLKNIERNNKWMDLLNNSNSRDRIEQVGPLTVSKWHQGGGYNQDCPYNANCGNLHPPAGCVAIAMAQVMYYYRFPDFGTGSFSYNPSYNNNQYGTLSADFENTHYEWDKMVPMIISSNNEVANLVSHCGIATLMDYQLNVSGTPTGLVDDALINYFKYNPSMEFISKSEYSDLEWAETLRNNLDQNMIMVYRGSSGFDGHAWICDGYMDDNYFHFNVGWGGSQNGYYLLEAINMSGYDFTGSQQAIVNIYPDTLNNIYPEIQQEYIFTSSCGSFTDGSKAANYTSNYEGHYLIDISELEASEISLHFDQIQTENEKDIINVYAGANETAELIISLSGNHKDFKLDIPGSQVYITFTTDEENNRKGWSASYYSVPFCTSTTILGEEIAIFSDGSGSLPYYSYSDCKWLIQPQGESTDSISEIIFKFNKLDIALNDTLIFYGGSSDTDEIVATINGNSPPDSIVVTSNMALIHFKTYENQENDGWELKYSIRGPVYCSDTTVLTSNEGSLSDGSINSKLYRDYSDCYWRIAPPGAGYVEFQFTAADVELYYDWVDFFDPTTNPPTLIERFTGHVIPPSIRSESGQLLIHFKTDYAIRKQGWEANYSSGETAIPENILSQIKFYPNPVNDFISLDIPQNINEIDYYLYNILGNIVIEEKSVKSKLHRINLQFLEKGLYILQIRSKNDIINRRVIKSL